MSRKYKIINTFRKKRKSGFRKNLKNIKSQKKKIRNLVGGAEKKTLAAAEQKTLGNDLIKKKKYLQAIEKYQEGLDALGDSSSEDDNLLRAQLLSNILYAYTMLKQFEEINVYIDQAKKAAAVLGSEHEMSQKISTRIEKIETIIGTKQQVSPVHSGEGGKGVGKSSLQSILDTRAGLCTSGKECVFNNLSKSITEQVLKIVPSLLELKSLEIGSGDGFTLRCLETQTKKKFKKFEMSNIDVSHLLKNHNVVHKLAAQDISKLGEKMYSVIFEMDCLSLLSRDIVSKFFESARNLLTEDGKIISLTINEPEISFYKNVVLAGESGSYFWTNIIKKGDVHFKALIKISKKNVSFKKVAKGLAIKNLETNVSGGIGGFPDKIMDLFLEKNMELCNQAMHPIDTQGGIPLCMTEDWIKLTQNLTKTLKAFGIPKINIIGLEEYIKTIKTLAGLNGFSCDEKEIEFGNKELPRFLYGNITFEEGMHQCTKSAKGSGKYTLLVFTPTQ